MLTQIARSGHEADMGRKLRAHHQLPRASLALLGRPRPDRRVAVDHDCLLAPVQILFF
jgi:hypothetical protein